MNLINRKGIIVSLGLLLAFSLFMTGDYFSTNSVSNVQIVEQVIDSPRSEQDLKWTGTVYVSKNGELLYEGSNLLTDAGANALKELIGNGVGTSAGWKYIAVGNGSAPTTGSTTLNSEIASAGLTRASATYTSLGTGSWKLEKIFSVTGTINSINATAMFNASSTGNMIAGDTFTNTNVINGDTLNITWTVTLS